MMNFASVHTPHPSPVLTSHCTMYNGGILELNGDTLILQLHKKSVEQFGGKMRQYKRIEYSAISFLHLLT